MWRALTFMPEGPGRGPTPEKRPGVPVLEDKKESPNSEKKAVDIKGSESSRHVKRIVRIYLYPPPPYSLCRT